MTADRTESGATLLSVRDLHVRFSNGQTTIDAVHGVSFEIRQGKTLALVGESGSGKSVTALSILRLLNYPQASHPAGRIMFGDLDLMAASTRELRRVRGNRISMIFQEPMSSLNPLHTVERQIGETLALHQGMRPGPARRRILELLDQVGIRDPESRLRSFPHQLSGGQRQRVMIAMALSNKPDILIADEPTTSLDVTIQAQILALLKKLQADLGMAMLFITHDLGIMRKMADTICVMQHGLIVERGDGERLFTSPHHAYTKRLLAAESKGSPNRPAPGAETIISVTDLKVWFPVKTGIFRRTTDHIKAVDGVSLEIKRGESLGVVGESGSGKTTLGLAILRLLPSSGPIAFLGERIDGRSARAMRPLRRNMQIVFQDPYGALSPRMTIGEIITEGLGVYRSGLSRTETEEKRDKALLEVGLEPAMATRYPHEFSGGQRQRIAIARTLVLEPKFIVLDEPTSALDVSIQAQIVDLLKSLQSKHELAYLFISHDLKVVRAMASRLIILKDGRIVEEGASDQLFKNPQSAYTSQLIAASLDHRAIVN